MILGSSSQWRRKVFTKVGCRIADAMDPNIDEKKIRRPDPEKLVLAISHAKADSLMSRVCVADGGFLICTDQVAVCEGVVREKPESPEEARKYIHSYSTEGKPVETCSGVVVVDITTGKRVEGTYWNSIWFSPIPQTVVDEIVAGSVVYTCCGGFSVDCPIMGKYVLNIEGTIDGVMGMPLGLLEELFTKIS